ncbi:hypothetical protein ACLB2K_071990 [Fragaria x ananassa]
MKVSELLANAKNYIVNKARGYVLARLVEMQRRSAFIVGLQLRLHGSPFQDLSVQLFSVFSARQSSLSQNENQWQVCDSTIAHSSSPKVNTLASERNQILVGSTTSLKSLYYYLYPLYLRVTFCLTQRQALTSAANLRLLKMKQCYRRCCPRRSPSHLVFHGGDREAIILTTRGGGGISLPLMSEDVLFGVSGIIGV